METDPYEISFGFAYPVGQGFTPAAIYIAVADAGIFFLLSNGPPDCSPKFFRHFASKFGTSFQIPAFDYTKKKKHPTVLFSFWRRCRDFLLVIERSTGPFSQIFSAFGLKIWNLVSNPCFLIILKRKKHPSVLFSFWRRCRDLNPGNGLSRLHDFQSCSFGQLGHICI